MGVGDMGVGGVGAFVQQLHLRWGDAEQVFVLAAAHKQHTFAPAEREALHDLQWRDGLVGAQRAGAVQQLEEKPGQREHKGQCQCAA